MNFLESKIALTLPHSSVNQLLLSEDLVLQLAVSCKLLLYCQPNDLVVLGALEELDGCSVCGFPCVFLQSILDYSIILSIQRMCKGCSSNELVFDQTMLHRVWGYNLACSNGWYDLNRPNHICQRDCPCFNGPDSIVHKSFYPFDYQQRLCDLGDYGIIPLFIFIDGPVPALCQNVLPYSNKGMTVVCLTHVSPQLTHIASPFRLLQQFKWYKS